MGYRDLIPLDALACVKKLEQYGYGDVLDFMYEFGKRKKSIVDSVSMYLGFPNGTSPDIIFRKTLDAVDEILGVKYGDSLFLDYKEDIISTERIRERIQEVQKRLRIALGFLGSAHTDGGFFALAIQLEEHARFKTFDATLYSSPGAINIITHEYLSLDRKEGEPY